MSTYIVTGASGYIASKIVIRLVNLGEKVIVILRETSSTELLKDVLDQIEVFSYHGKVEELVDVFNQEKPDYVIHLASLFIAEHKTQDVDNLIKSNILFGTQLLEAMACSGTKCLINTATSWQHYEDAEYNPVCLYAATKQAFEDIVRYYVETRNLRAITLTIFDTYGIGDPRNKIISLFKRIAITNQKLEMSEGKQELDLIYIDDIVDAYLCAINMFNQTDIKNEVYSINSGKPKSLREIAQIYESVNDVKLPIYWGGRAYREREVMHIYRKGKRLPGWKAKIDLIQGLSIIRDNESSKQMI